MERTPHCRIYYYEGLPHYVVYDRFGSVMALTESRSIAQQYLDLANRGISAQLHYWLERWNYRIPKYIYDQI